MLLCCFCCGSPVTNDAVLRHTTHTKKRAKTACESCCAIQGTHNMCVYIKPYTRKAPLSVNDAHSIVCGGHVACVFNYGTRTHGAPLNAHTLITAPREINPLTCLRAHAHFVSCCAVLIKRIQTFHATALGLRRFFARLRFALFSVCVCINAFALMF